MGEVFLKCLANIQLKNLLSVEVWVVDKIINAFGQCFMLSAKELD